MKPQAELWPEEGRSSEAAVQAVSEGGGARPITESGQLPCEGNI